MTGGSGLLGRYLKIKADRPSHRDLDITKKIKPKKYDLIIHSAAYTNVQGAETDQMQCFNVNVKGTLNLLNTYPNVPFVYISTESFTDMDFSAFLIKMRLKGLDIRILSGATSMDFQDRMNNMLRELLSQDIGIRTTVGDIHAKLVITDKHLVVSSVNLNKMNLGFHITKRYWRQNTESISVCSDTEIIEQAKIQYLNIYNISNDIKKTLAEKIESLVGDMLISNFGLRSRNEVKFLFARLIVSKEIEVKKFINDIGKITFKLMKIFNRNTVEKNDFISALILYYLSESKHNFNQLNEKLSNLGTEIDLSSLITGLLDRNLIERVDDFYKIKLDELLRG